MKDFHSYADMRAVYTDTLTDIAEKDERLVVFEADLMAATGTKTFKARFPKRLINAGVAEANMVGLASGLSAQGFIPFVNTFGCFAARRAYDQFFLSANYAQQNVKLVGTDPGVTAQFNGGTHMPFCDTALMRVVPGLTVVEPSDTVSLHVLTKQLLSMDGCAYMRLNRKGAVTRYADDQRIEVGKGITVRDGSDVTLIAAGFLMMEEALKAADKLAEKHISAAVIDMHTIKPLDTELVAAYAEKTGALITCENAEIIGGLGGAVSEFIVGGGAQAIVKRVGVNDAFGEVGTLEYLMKRYSLTADTIVEQAEKAVKEK